MIPGAPPGARPPWRCASSPIPALVLRLTRGRMWIGVLGALLAGIVALNVISLGLTATSGRAGQDSS